MLGDILRLQRTVGNRATGSVLARFREAAPANPATALVTILPQLPSALRPIVERIVAAVHSGKVTLTPAQVRSLQGLLRDLVASLHQAGAEGPAMPVAPEAVLPGGTVALSKILSTIIGTDVTAILEGNDLFLPATWLEQHPIDVTGVFGEESDDSTPPAGGLEGPSPLPLLESPEDVRKRKSAEAFDEFASKSGERATAEAQQVTRTPPSARQQKRQARVLGQKHQRGPEGANPLLEEHKERVSKAEKSRQNKEREKQTREAQRAEGQKKRQARDEERRQQKEEAKAQEQRALRAREYEQYAPALRSAAQALLTGVEVAHHLVRAYLDSTTHTVKRMTDRANAALHAEAQAKLQAPTSGAALKQSLDTVGQLKSELDTLISALDSATSGVVSKLRSKATDRLRDMELDGLSAMLLYSAPGLQAANVAVTAAIAGTQWHTIAEDLDVLRAEVDALKPAHSLIRSLENRAQHLTTTAVVHADLTYVTDQLAKKSTIPADQLLTYARALDARLWQVQRPHAQTIFDTAKTINDAAANTALESLLDAGMIARGGFNKKYRTSWDTQGGYSVEYTIKGINTIVIHAHCTAGGVPKPGNGSHWKMKSHKTEPGYTHEITATLRVRLIDPEDHKKKPIKTE